MNKIRRKDLAAKRRKNRKKAAIENRILFVSFAYFRGSNDLRLPLIRLKQTTEPVPFYSSLDKWYVMYEKQFDEASGVESLFTTVLGELQQILSDIRSTRWRKRSDFYTLFCVMAAHKNALPLDKKSRSKAGAMLKLFATQVDLYVEAQKLQANAELAKVNKGIRRYVVAVQRAASDLGSRKERSESLEGFLKPLWS